MNEILEERDAEGILWLTFNRPEARNAMTFAMYDRLGEIAREINRDDSVRVVVLQGAGEKAFVAGTDISQFKSFTTEEDSFAYEERMEREIGALAAIRVPTIAAVRGACTGGGFAIAGACDIRVGSPSARFGIPIARTLGNCLSMASVNLLIDLLGPARVKEMIFTARLIEAPEAKQAGILQELVESEEALRPRVTELARQIAGNAPLTLRAVKEAMRRVMEARHIDPLAGRDLIAMCYLSEDFQEGLAAFLEKRKPQWQGR